MGKSTISMVIFNSKLLVITRGYVLFQSSKKLSYHLSPRSSLDEDLTKRSSLETPDDIHRILNILPSTARTHTIHTIYILKCMCINKYIYIYMCVRVSIISIYNVEYKKYYPIAYVYIYILYIYDMIICTYVCTLYIYIHIYIYNYPCIQKTCTLIHSSVSYLTVKSAAHLMRLCCQLWDLLQASTGAKRREWGNDPEEPLPSGKHTKNYGKSAF